MKESVQLMRIAIFSDIHSNLEALQAVLDHTFQRDADKHVCLGDVVGYGADPNGCLDLLRSLPHCPAVLGNHDAAVLGLPIAMGRESRQVIDWTKRNLSVPNLRYLQNMQDVIRWDKILFCHSNPYRPRNWYYIAERNYITASFGRSRAKIVFVGHTHVPVAITRKNFFCVYIRDPLHHMTVPAAECNRQIFNCGSVGQPRDGDVRASYLIYDTGRQRIEFYRVDYDYTAAGRKIIDAGLPEMFARRLTDGI